MPLAVVTHGAGGFAEWHCEHLRELLGTGVILLCPRGKRRHAKDPEQGYYYPNHFALRAEVLAATQSLHQRAEPWIQPGPMLYVGYSQGATMGALALAEYGKEFPRWLLVEGGFADWSKALVRNFIESGGKRILLVCGTSACHEKGRDAVQRLAKAGVPARLGYARGAGHRPDGPVESPIRKGLPWLLESFAGWNLSLAQ